MRLIFAAVSIFVLTVLTGCGHKPPQATPPSVNSAPGATATVTVDAKGQKKQQCDKNGVCK